jgi:SAM-dependent methyltransferase
VEEAASVHTRIEAYYGARVRRFGATPQGVDWACRPTQELRFVKLLGLCDFSQSLSINDIGCGYGALATFIAHRHPQVPLDYLGVDLSAEMIKQAKRGRVARRDGVRFEAGFQASRTADYSLASGIFNVQLDFPTAVWEANVRRTLTQMAATSRKAFAVNFLSTHRSSSTQGLYFADPCIWVSFCEAELGAKVTVVSGYGMPEFTLLALI